jgi:uncharacterized protein (TIRG00374 family)
LNETPQQPIPLGEAESQKFVRSMRLSRMVLPIILGLVAVGYLFYRQFDIQRFREIEWTGHAFAWIGLAFLLLLLRHVFYALRLKILTGGNYFTFRKCLELIVIWEFSGALTPTSKGGPFVMMFVLAQEKVPAGRTAAAIFYTMICDTGFFVILMPILLSIYGPPMLYPGMKSYSDQNLASQVMFFTYGMMVVYWSVLMFFVFFRPQYAKISLTWLSRIRLLKRFAPKLTLLGEEFELAATEMRQQNAGYHLRVILCALGSWTSKFLMINCLIIAIVPGTPIDGSTQAFIYARLVAMFIIMAFSPTPGGAGLAEIALAGFISDYVPPGIGLVVALLWRGMAYYGYLIAGALVVPGWIAAKVSARKKALT